MGVLSISAPASLESALANRATLFGVQADVIYRLGDTITVTLTGDPIKCLNASALMNVKRVGYRETTMITKEDRLPTIKAVRQKP